MFSYEKRLIIRHLQRDGDKCNFRFFDTNKEMIFIEKPEEGYFELTEIL